MVIILNLNWGIVAPRGNIVWARVVIFIKVVSRIIIRRVPTVLTLKWVGIRIICIGVHAVLKKYILLRLSTIHELKLFFLFCTRI